MNSRHSEMAMPVLRAGTRGSPLALFQTRLFLRLLAEACPEWEGALQEQVIATTGDAVQDRALAEIGGKGLFAKEIHEALLERRIDCAVHSLKDLETELPPGIVLACTLAREDARDVLILGQGDAAPDPSDPYGSLAPSSLIGTSSVRRQAQLLHARPDLRVVSLRGNVQTRLRKLREGPVQATLLALAGLRRLEMEQLPGATVLDPETMVPSAGQGIIGITARAGDTKILELLAKVEDAESRAVASAERAMLASLDGSCRTPIGGYARVLPEGQLILTGMVARADGSFLLKRHLAGALSDSERLGRALGDGLRADSPANLYS